MNFSTLFGGGALYRQRHGRYSPSATGRKSAQRFEGGGQISGSTGNPARCFH
ncbi:MAG: hypothetical protein HFJ07_13350 [Lachnospiraceae bacterium]|nr:hypothetical protein [Lachnospiraceae bacterium]